MKYVIRYIPVGNPLIKRYMRVYQRGRRYVPETHLDMATRFDTRSRAQEIIEKFELGDVELITEYRLASGSSR